MLARKEMQIALPKLFHRLQNLAVMEDGSDTKYWPGLLHRGIGAVRLSFSPGAKLRAGQ
jgi:cytochrome P450